MSLDNILSTIPIAEELFDSLNDMSEAQTRLVGTPKFTEALKHCGTEEQNEATRQRAAFQYLQAWGPRDEIHYQINTPEPLTPNEALHLLPQVAALEDPTDRASAYAKIAYAVVPSEAREQAIEGLIATVPQLNPAYHVAGYLLAACVADANSKQETLALPADRPTASYTVTSKPS